MAVLHGALALVVMDLAALAYVFERETDVAI
jgi:hypothetical protein